jgi:hypothetical protein
VSTRQAPEREWLGRAERESERIWLGRVQVLATAVAPEIAWRDRSNLAALDER